MSPWTALLGLVGVIGLTGQAGLAALPPGPLVEGREPDPVVREFHQDEALIGGYVDPTADPIEGASEGQDSPTMPLLLWEQLLDELTFPLGTAVMDERSEITGA